MSYKPHSLFRLLEEMDKELFLPHIQRPFVWDEEQMEKLLDSLMRSYPTQTLLFWRTKEQIKIRKFMSSIDREANLHSLYDYTKSGEGHEKRLVLDGQQRLQTLRAIFDGALVGSDGISREAHIDITTGEEEDEEGLRFRVTWDAAGKPALPLYRLRNLRSVDQNKNYEKLADGLNDALDGILQEDPTTRRQREKNVRRNIGQLIAILREDKYFWIEELDGIADRYDYSTVLDIFVRVNSGGTKLSAADLMFASIKEASEDFEKNVEEVLELLNGTGLQFDESFVIKCLLVAAGRGAKLSPKMFTGTTGQQVSSQLDGMWTQAEVAFEELRDFIVQDLRLYGPKVVRSHVAFVPLFDYLYFNPRPDPTNRARMKAYHYRAQLFNWFAFQTDNTLNALHNHTGKAQPSFPLADVTNYFAGAGRGTNATIDTLMNARLRHVFLNLVYVEQFGSSPFDVAYIENMPHVDHIYPKSKLTNDLKLPSAEINHIGNFRFVGGTDNKRKRAELPGSYFTRLKASGIPIEKHLLCPAESADPMLMKMDAATYLNFRNRRLSEIFTIVDRVVNI